MDQLTAMRVFARVVEAGTFTRAADSLQMPKPSVTKLVQQLESHLRVKLLQRTTRRVTVTPEGAAYFERAVRVLADIDEIEADLTHAQVSPRGRLRVDIGSSLANQMLIPLLPDFHRRYPDIQLELGVSDRPVDLIGEGVDCVIRGSVLVDSALIARRIGELRFLSCATPAYLARHGVPAHPMDLMDGHAVIGYFSTRTGRLLPLHYGEGEAQIEVVPRTVISVNESTAHLSAALTGLGIVQTLAFMAAPHIDRGTLVPVLADWPQGAHPVYLVYPPNRHLGAKLRVFIDWVVEAFAPLRG